MIQVELPRDAEGREIPLSTETMYSLDGEVVKVRNFEYWPSDCIWRMVVSVYSNHYEKPECLLLFPPDSWEKLEHDIYHLVMGEYLDDPEGDVKDVISRAKALAEREG